MMANGLAAISAKTMELWYKVNKKYGNHVYILGVNGRDKVVLSKGYMQEIAIGNKQAQRVLAELLKK